MPQTKKIKETIIRDYGTQNVGVSQTTKGKWYFPSISIYCDNIWDGLTLADAAIEEAEKILKKHNKAKKVTDGEKDA